MMEPRRKFCTRRASSARCELYRPPPHGRVDDEHLTELWHGRQTHFRRACCSREIVELHIFISKPWRSVAAVGWHYKRE